MLPDSLSGTALGQLLFVVVVVVVVVVVFASRQEISTVYLWRVTAPTKAAGPRVVARSATDEVKGEQHWMLRNLKYVGKCLEFFAMTCFVDL